MKKDLTATAVGLIVLTLVLGLLYPLAVTGVGQVVFNDAANGSQIRVDGKVVGSRLLGQGFSRAEYFHSRPSQSDYNPSATFFSNAGPNGADTRDAIARYAAAYLKTEGRYDPGLTRAQIPPDAVQTSASGVDPQITVANARIQAHRIAAVRRLPLDRVNRLIDDHTDGRGLGLFGEPGVNVLELNLALDKETR
ncbi:potassium-transporting ATPase subunit KdpC [Conexibacter sp. JD483]|uniref:potassium-transporting ATPase subunit KdpC n=1 Tax=unclassified Conexibacter TaxID=2627773 RepID=UPI0027159D64|nr:MULTISPECIES: potassium-transporting ATPase subunit KdpC [unclassified Conexibacter]MDO8189461.1 potassium-transporting ATPase subunit KdpC [Conexibacter sp. CPCC 205706]MDO8201626.1 potassium-transporting ATPase subunit KdpC [Conexibacter sp. CPCC 205762]MDR9372620.1 potassium-transporting ATPase subunit KdpC [Conexibacter sp. JD483]